jgi:protein-tyrosine phosphatase
MRGILVVCTGNICRSPMAEGFLRGALRTRLGEDAPEVVSAGTHGWDGSPATAEAVEAARERGAAIEGHRARVLTGEMVDAADLVVCMATEHRDAVRTLRPDAAARTFTLKELVRLLRGRGDDAERDVTARIAAAAVRRNGGSPAFDEDVADPLGQPLEAYRGIAWELDTMVNDLVSGLYGAGRG